MENHAFAHRYQEVAIRTANPMQLIVILYDAAICSLQEAREHIENKNIEARSRSVNKCISIISELQSSLDQKKGGDIARSLNRLYDYMKTRIFMANAERNPRILEEVESLLQNLQSAWRTLADQIREKREVSGLPEMPDNAILGTLAPAAALPIKSLNVSI